MKIQNLTKYLLASFASAALLSTVACSEEENKVEAPASKIEIKDFTLVLDDGDTTLTFFAENDWTATLSTTSWINIDATTRSGLKGSAKIILNWEENKSVNVREAVLTIAPKNETPVKIRISQFSKAPILTLSRENSSLSIRKSSPSDRGLFTDTITVDSNLKWEVKSLPEWIDYNFVGDKKPQEGVPTEIKLALVGNTRLFTAAEMTGEIVIGSANHPDSDKTIAAKAVSELEIVTSNEDNTPVSSVIMERIPGANNQYTAKVFVKSNTAWSLIDLPQWATASVSDNASDYNASLETGITVFIAMKDGLLDTDRLEHPIRFYDKTTKLEKTLDIIFPGTGNDFYEMNFVLNADYRFPATKADEIADHDHLLTRNFPMLSAADYSNLNEAPFKFFFIKAQNGFPVKEEVFWAGVELNNNAASMRSTVINKELTLWLSERNSATEWASDPYAERHALMVVAPKDLPFDSLFIKGTEDLKPEYESTRVFIGQSGLKKVIVNEIPQEVVFTAAADTKPFALSGIDGPSTYVDGEFGGGNDWMTIEFEGDDFGVVSGVKISTKPNITGKARSCKVEIKQFIMDNTGEREELFYSFTVQQAAE